MSKPTRSVLAALVALTIAAGIAQEAPPNQAPPQGRGEGAGRQGLPRDRAQGPQGTAVISGRVLTADSGRPVKRARVMVTGGGRGDGRQRPTSRGATASMSSAPAITPSTRRRPALSTASTASAARSSPAARSSSPRRRRSPTSTSA